MQRDRIGVLGVRRCSSTACNSSIPRWPQIQMPHCGIRAGCKWSPKFGILISATEPLKAGPGRGHACRAQWLLRRDDAHSLAAVPRRHQLDALRRGGAGHSRSASRTRVRRRPRRMAREGLVDGAGGVLRGGTSEESRLVSNFELDDLNELLSSLQKAVANLPGQRLAALVPARGLAKSAR